MENEKLDKEVLAECECGREKKVMTFRKLKNKWPHCSKCNQPMKVKVKDAVPPIHTAD